MAADIFITCPGPKARIQESPVGLHFVTSRERRFYAVLRPSMRPAVLSQLRWRHCQRFSKRAPMLAYGVVVGGFRVHTFYAGAARALCDESQGQGAAAHATVSAPSSRPRH